MNIGTQIQSLLDILEFLLNKLNVANIVDLKDILEESINEILTIKNNLSDIENEKQNEYYEEDDSIPGVLEFKEEKECDIEINRSEEENTDNEERKVVKEEQETSTEEKHFILNHHLQSVESVVKIGIKSIEKQIPKSRLSEHVSLRKRCEICNFEYKGDREEHIADNHVVNGKYCCQKCDFVSDYEHSLIVHSRTHKKSPLYLCLKSGCCKTFKKVVGERGFLKHFEDEHDYSAANLTCPICNEKRSTKGSLFAHIQRIHNSNLDLQCKKCLKTMTTPQTYVKHMKYYHGNVQSLVCQECGFSTKYESMMKKHNQARHPNSAVKKVFLTNCEFCGTRLPYKERTKHVEDHHVIGGKYHCPTCNYVAENEDGLRNHCNSEHNNKSVLFYCPECSENFQRVEGLINHMDEEHNFKVEELKCPICDREQTNRKHLDAHIRKSHSNVDCQCKKCFIFKNCEESF